MHDIAGSEVSGPTDHTNVSASGVAPHAPTAIRNPNVPITGYVNVNPGYLSPPNMECRSALPSVGKPWYAYCVGVDTPIST